MKLIQKIIGLYFFTGAIAFYIFYLSLHTSETFFVFLIPSTIVTLVFIFYLAASYYYLKYPNRPIYENIFMIMILIQSIGIELKGFAFSNFYFPMLDIRINLIELTDITFRHSYFTIRTVNGYFKNAPDNSITINLLLFGLLFLIPFLSKKVKANKEKIYISSEIV